jgi:alpha-glucosidase
VDSSRRARYASPEGLGQAFNFDLLEADFDAVAFRTVIEHNLALAEASGSSSTWVLSNHDVVRHATRYGLPVPADPKEKRGSAWLLAGGVEPVLDREGGLRRARAATLMMLALPGSAYLYQGEELGLHEVADIPASKRQDPAFFRNSGQDVGRDGCRVPIPWTRTGSSFGFGSNGAHLPQPEWFGDASVEAQDGVPEATLSLYREALGVRRRLQAAETLEWVHAGPSVLHFTRPGGWHSITNFGSAPVDLPPGQIQVTSGPLSDGRLPAETTAWVISS